MLKQPPNPAEVRKMENDKLSELSDKIAEIWQGIEGIIASLGGIASLGPELSKLQEAEMLLKFAKDLARDPEKVFNDGGFRVHFRENNEVAIEAVFDKIHLHTEFLNTSTSSLETIHTAFTNPKVRFKMVLQLVSSGLEAISEAISDWIVKHY
jgi:hypothetical protein